MQPLRLIAEAIRTSRVRTSCARAGSIFAVLTVLIATTMLPGCAKTRDDASIAADIQSRFYNDAGVKAASIQVAVNQGHVTLTGEAPSPEVKDRAIQLARGAAGVSGVEDHVTVAVASAPPVAPPSAEAASPKGTIAKPKVARPKPKMETTPSGSAAAAAPAAAEERAQPAASAAPEPPAPPQPARITIPVGTHLSISMIDSIDSSKDKAGQVFHASLDAPIVVDGEEAVPAGADVYVRLATAKAAGHISGSSELELQLVKMVTNGRTYPLVSDSYTAKGKSRGTESATRIGGGAVVGAIVGAIAGGKKGAAIGAAAGAGAGTAVQLATRGQQVKVPSETVLDFELQQAVVVTKK